MMTMQVEERLAASDSSKFSYLTLSKDRLHQREKRLFPRLFANISMKYIALDASASVPHIWMRTGQLPKEIPKTKQDWSSPEPFMNFSANGLSFFDSNLLSHSTILLIELELMTPSEDSSENSNQSWSTHRCIGRVVRCRKLEDDRYESAIYFEQITEQTQDVLSSLTLKIQNAML